MTAALSAACAESALFGLAIVTSPAPIRSAPRAASLAAPVVGISPDTTTAWPRSYLWPPAAACGNAAIQSGGSLANVCGLISLSTAEEMPISATFTGPQCSRPGSSRCPGFLRKKVTVSVALTAAPITAPLSPLMPLGRSTATTGTPDCIDRFDERPRASLRPAGRGRRRTGHRRSPREIRALPDRRARSASPTAPPPAPHRLSGARGSPISISLTSRPLSASSLAATNPSPPLLPGPATTKIGPE